MTRDAARQLLRGTWIPADDVIVANDVLPDSGAGSSPPQRSGFLRRNLFAIWGALMLVGGVTRLIVHRDGAGFVGVGLGVAFLLTDGVKRHATDLRTRQSKK